MDFEREEDVMQQAVAIYVASDTRIHQASGSAENLVGTCVYIIVQTYSSRLLNLLILLSCAVIDGKTSFAIEQSECWESQGYRLRMKLS